MVDQTLPFLLERGLQPEIAFRGPELDEVSPKELERVASRLASAGLAITVHGPFHDLNPGALEPLVSEVTRSRFDQTLEAAGRLGASLVVLHPGYDRWKYGGQDHLWLEQNLRFWPSLLERAAALACPVALENIFETRPQPLVDLLEAIDSPWLGHCFDTGHWNLFADTPLPDWFAALGRRTIHMHLHDNRGDRDEHLPVGEGSIDFGEVFRLIAEITVPPRMTLEAHDRPSLLRSLAAVAPFLAP